MLSKHFSPAIHFGCKFDKGSILCEFDALREPERTRFPQIGAWLRAKGIEFNEIPTPQMLWRGRFWPDLYIANQLDAADGVMPLPIDKDLHPSRKSEWADNLSLDTASSINHSGAFHVAFIETMCRKITGRPSREIAARFHRSAWLPIYHPETLRARASIRTPFWYPKAGYAGAIASGLGVGVHTSKRNTSSEAGRLDATDISIAYLLAKPAQGYSVCFVVDDSEIYRVTDMDVCSGLNPEYHRFVVESRGYGTDILKDLRRMGLTGEIKNVATGSAQMALPTIKNVQAGWKPAPHMNDQLWAMMEAERAATQP